MAISSKLRQQMAEGGWIRKMFEEGIALKKKYGERNVFDLTLGNLADGQRQEGPGISAPERPTTNDVEKIAKMVASGT